MRSTALAVVLLGFLSAGGAAQQRPETGPIVTSGGPTFLVEDPDFPIPTDRELKAAFELVDGPSSPEHIQQQLGTMARYLNMHVRHGMPRENVRVAGVVHGGASWALLRDEHYRAEFGVDNPNKALIEEIVASGGQVILCGQTAGSRGITKDQLLPGVQMALSAMTALTVLQQDGYQIILW